MMKWKASTKTTNIGILELDNLTFNEDYMQVFIDICDISDNLKAEVDKAIEATKVKYTEEIKSDIAEYRVHPLRRGTVWSDKPVVIDYTYLSIALEADKPIKYCIVVGFHDADNEHLVEDASITVDLSEHTDELKKEIVKALIDKFF